MAAKISNNLINIFAISVSAFFTCPPLGLGKQEYKTKTVPLDIMVDGKLFHAEKNSYWRENYNAHSYYVIVLSFIEDDRLNEIIPLLDQNKSFVDTLIDAPGSDCFRKSVQFVEDVGPSYLAILENLDTKDRVTLVHLHKATYNKEGLPGFPPLYFEFVQDVEMPKTCKPAGVDAGLLFKQIRHN